MRKVRSATHSSRRVSHGTGSPKARIFAAFAAFAALALAALLLTSCSPDMKDGLGPRVPVSNISGRAERDGASASPLDVSVRDTAGNEAILEIVPPAAARG